MKYFIYVSYHLKLEAKFLMDEFAMPPQLDKLTPQCDLFDARSTTEKDYEEDEETVPLLTCEVEGRDNDNQKQTSESESECDRFTLALKKIVLSSSPFCNYSVPYLLTKEGSLCPTRQYIVNQIYSSKYLSNTICHFQPNEFVEEEEESSFLTSTKNSNVLFKQLHPFTDPSVLINCVDNRDNMKTILNDFRAQGGQVDLMMYHQYEKQELHKIYGDSLVRKMSSGIKEPIRDEVGGKETILKKSMEPKVCIHSFTSTCTHKHTCTNTYTHVHRCRHMGFYLSKKIILY